MEGFNNENLSDFFNLVTVQKKESNKKTINLKEDTSLNDLFASVSEEKKKEKKKRKEIIGDVSLDDLFSSLSEEKKKLKETEIEKKQEIEQLEKEAKVFESFLYSESTKKEEKLEEKPPKPKKSKKKTSKKDVIVNKIEEKEEIQEKVDQNLQKSLDILDKLKRNDTDIENEEDPALRKLKLEVEQLRKLVESSIRTATAQGGGGEVRLEFLDDVDRDSVKVDGKFLKYQASTGTFIGADASGGDSEEASKLVLDARNNNVGYAITIGTPVYQTTFNSGQDRINIEEARADNSSTMPAKGVTITDLENNTNGQILVYGELEGVDTSAFEVADELFVAPSGGLTNTRPTDPGHLVQKIAVVLKKSAANGAILVYGAGRANDVPNQINISGVITATSFVGDVTGDLTGNADSSTVSEGLTGTPNITVGIITASSAEFSGNVTVGGTITYEDVTNIDSVGVITARSGINVTSNGLDVTGISTISTGIGTVHIGVGQTTLLVDGDARVTGILTVGRGSITLDPNRKKITGVDDIVVGSGASLSLAPFLTQKGKFQIDYSTIILSGYGSLSGTYNRQSTSFYLISAPSYSGSARFFNASGYYYFLNDSDNSKIIIYNIYDGYWSAIHSIGSDFSSPSNYQLVSPVTNFAFIHPFREFLDGTGRYYPAATSGIEYATTVVGQTSILGIATASILNVTGVSTFKDDIFLGDGDRAYFGADNDLAIFHNSNNGNSVISALQDGKLNINATTHTFKNQAGSETKATFNNNGSVELYHDNTKKIETSGLGVTVYGTTKTDEVILPEALIQSGVLTTTTTDASTIVSLDASIYRSGCFKIQSTEGSNYNITNITLIHDGSSTYMNEYGTINQPVGIATFSSSISGGNMNLVAYPSSSNSTTFKVSYTAINT